MTRVAVVDFGLSNIDSVVRAIEELGGKPRVARAPANLVGIDKIVLPGVGAFGEAMANLRASGLADAMTDAVVGEGVPCLGICLGMQLLATTGTEGGTHDGLGWIPGEVVRLEPTNAGERVPHVGWNEVAIAPSSGTLFVDTPETADFYFVHSYHLRCDPAAVAGTTPYCGGFVSAVEVDNLFGVQFHPEKSQEHGLGLLNAFLAR